jgi:restriction system protein
MLKKRSYRFSRFFQPVLDALGELGGSGTPSEVKKYVLNAYQLSAEERDRVLPSGTNAVENEIAWARDYLRRAGFIDGSTSGVWTITREGRQAKLSTDSAYELKERLNRERTAERKGVNQPETVTSIPSDEADTVFDTLEEEVISVLRELSPSGFERFCKRLLRESGFVEVEVTGKSGDGGIDGVGVLRINELVSFRVLFQCKRYQGAVGSKEIRDFRGSMTGRTDKGIFITTGSFTSASEQEANRDGAPPIELVDADRLVTLMKRFNIGLTEKTIHVLDRDFFEEFRQ